MARGQSCSFATTPNPYLSEKCEDAIDWCPDGEEYCGWDSDSWMWMMKECPKTCDRYCSRYTVKVGVGTKVLFSDKVKMPCVFYGHLMYK